MSPTAAVLLGLLPLFLLVLLPMAIRINSLSDGIDKSIAEFSGNQMKLYQKSSKLKRRIKIRKHKNVAIGRTAEEVHIGAVSVGGVTSGGVYKTGNNLYIAESKKTGRYELAYVKNLKQFTNEYVSISSILLTDELFKEAKESYISEYLDEKDKSILVVDFRNVNISSNDLYQSAMETMKITSSSGSAGMNGIGGASMKVQQKSNSAYPTKQKCLEIIAWLAGEEKPVSEDDEQEENEESEK